MCGENGRRPRGRHRIPGSSPSVRGKRPPTTRAAPHTGLIPACAGKTSSPSSRPWCPSAHPRVCGENWTNRGKTMPFESSSPSVRGKPAFDAKKFVKGRLIPACAGKTTPRRRRARQSRAHPRVCGENHATARRPERPTGSSPRVRGKPPCVRPCAGGGRLIPACAGKTPPLLASDPAFRAHPRVCGENRREGPVRPRLARLIPACAGKTRRVSYRGSAP